MRISAVALAAWAGFVASAQAGESAPTRFQFTDLDLRDPHLFVEFLGCRDFTDAALLEFSVNGSLQDTIQTDGDGDGYLDVAYLLQFTPLNQAAATNPLTVGSAQCTAPLAGTTCGPLTGAQASTATLDDAMTCLEPIVGTVRPYTPPVTNPGAPCFVSSPFTLTLNLLGAPLLLVDAQVAATFVGDPAGSLANGLVRGFLSEAVAANTVLPPSLPLIGGETLASLLPGYDGPGEGDQNCAAHDDRDVHNAVVGWWFYFNFPAQLIANLPDSVFADGFEDSGE